MPFFLCFWMIINYLIITTTQPFFFIKYEAKCVKFDEMMWAITNILWLISACIVIFDCYKYSLAIIWLIGDIMYMLIIVLFLSVFYWTRVDKFHYLIQEMNLQPLDDCNTWKNNAYIYYATKGHQWCIFWIFKSNIR